MKKNIILFIVSILIFSACSDENYADLNINPDRPSDAPSESLFVAATKSLVDQMTTISVNLNHFRFFAQYVAQRNFAAESNYELVERTVPQSHWSEIYRDVLLDLDDAKTRIPNEGLLGNVPSNRIAITEMLSVYAWQQLVDTFGDIPYTEALLRSESFNPAYEDAQMIYMDLFERINQALSLVDKDASGFGSSDKIYNDDISKWKKFGNSLKLRLAIRVLEVPAFTTIAQTAISEAVAAGVLTSNEDNAILKYETSQPNTNPNFVILNPAISGRPFDFFPANTIVDYMNNLEDPRRPLYFNNNLKDSSGNVIYKGGTYGTTNILENTTHLNPNLVTNPEFRGVLLSYSEVSFMLAQATELGVDVGSDAETFYNNGITASMQDWGVAADDITSYLDRSDVDYNTADGTWQEKLGLQYWLAMYNRGFEGWTLWRQLNAPALNVAVDSKKPVPVRYTYPVEEQTLNGTNYTAAATAIGGDTQQNKLFWDVN